MKSPKCQLENANGIKFCGECGYSRRDTKAPPRVDYSQPRSYTTTFLADEVVTSRQATEGECKVVTVLFADVAGYISMSEKPDIHVQYH